ncbi:MAG: hypothetical protein ABR928_17300 [Terracidiphilus sp.]|jgi:hypothetical protein
MEDTRCRIAAIEAEGPRRGGVLKGAVIEMEDPRCKSLRYGVMLQSPAIEIDDPRCTRVQIVVEDPRCKGLGNW